MSRASEILAEEIGAINDILCAVALLQWDNRTMMPTGGAQTRGQQIATLKGLARDRLMSTATRRAVDGLLIETEGWADDDLSRRAALTVQATLVHGYLGVFEALAANAATRLAFVDLSLSLGLVLLWMWGDAHERALPFWGYALVTLAFGVAGPLAYLLHRELQRAPARVAQRA